MGTGIVRRDIPTPTPQVDRSLSQQGLEDHRAKIAFEVKTVLSAYFQPHEAEATRAAQLAWWCDELQEWTVEQVVWALRDWNRANPRMRPTPGDITAIMRAARGRKHAASIARGHANEPPRPEPCSREAALEIMAAAGFPVRRFTDDAV